MQNVIDSTVDILDQLHEFIASIDAQSYQESSMPLFDSSIGQHLRHILDMFQALIKNIDAPLIDYDIRQRGIPLETDQSEGIIALNTVRQWLTALTPTDLERAVNISSEIDIAEQRSATFQSSFGRELLFASTHAIHHLALMVTIAKVMGCQVNSQYGVAPATASYIREQEKALEKEQEELPCAH
ncbi:MAG: DinB family protein [Amphritea sp.]